MKLPKYAKFVAVISGTEYQIETAAKVEKFAELKDGKLIPKLKSCRVARTNGSFVSLLIQNVELTKDAHGGNVLRVIGKEPETMEEFREMYNQNMKPKPQPTRIRNARIFSHTAHDSPCDDGGCDCC